MKPESENYKYISKRFFCRITALVLSICALCGLLTGCKEEFVIPERATKYGYFCYPGTEWGMTPAEVFEALNLKEEYFDKGIETELIGGLSGIVYTGKAGVLGDRSSNITLRFTRFSEDTEYAFSSMTVANSYQYGEKRVEQVKEMVLRYDVPITESYEENIHDEVPEPFTLKFVIFKSADMQSQAEDMRNAWNGIFPEGKAPPPEDSVLSVLAYQYLVKEKRYRFDYQAAPAAFIAWKERNSK